MKNKISFLVFVFVFFANGFADSYDRIEKRYLDFEGNPIEESVYIKEKCDNRGRVVEQMLFDVNGSPLPFLAYSVRLYLEEPEKSVYSMYKFAQKFGASGICEEKVFYDENNSKRLEIFFAKTKTIKECRCYNENEKLQLVFFYNNEGMVSKSFEYNENGDVTCTTIYDERGLAKETDELYEDGTRVKRFYTWDDDGEILDMSGKILYPDGTVDEII